MAFNATKTPLLKSILARGFAAQASQKFAASKANELQVTTLSNQILVASIDQNSPISHVSVVYRAGARDETYETQGITRALRIGATFSNKNSSDFRIRTNIKATGGALSADANRESFSYSLTLNRDQLDNGLRFLYDVSCQHDFKDWELEALPSRINDDFLALTPSDHALDALHQAAFSGGLGNSLYAAKVNVPNYTSDALHHFISTNFKANRAAIVGVGIDHATLLGFARSFQELEGAAATTQPSKYVSGQLKIDRAGSNATVAVGTQGASLSNQKEALAFEVLRVIAGGEKRIPNGSPNSALGKVVDGALKSPYEFQAFNNTYSDNGLFGFLLTANAKEIGKAIQSAVKALKSGSVSQGDVDAAKTALKVTVAEQLATSSGRFADLVSQASSGQIQGKSEILAAIDGISVADVNAAAKKVASGKWSIGAVGNLATVPHVQELN